MAAGVNRQFVDVDRDIGLGLLLGSMTTQEGFDSGGENPWAEWLGDVVVGSPIKACDHVALLALGREHDDRHLAGAGVSLESPANLQPVDGRKHQVEHYQIGNLLPNGLESLFTTSHAGDLVIRLREVVADQLQEIVLVINNKDSVTDGGRLARSRLRRRLLHVCFLMHEGS